MKTLKTNRAVSAAHSEAARRGWETRRRRAEEKERERVRVVALHTDEHTIAWARMSPAARETAVARGWGHSLPPDVLAEITK